MGGHIPFKILLEQGVPQGDIISPFIFIIAVEILLIKITNSRHIKGITLETEEEIRAQSFDNDTPLSIQRCIISIMACIRYIENFSKNIWPSCEHGQNKSSPFWHQFQYKRRIVQNPTT